MHQKESATKNQPPPKSPSQPKWQQQRHQHRSLTPYGDDKHDNGNGVLHKYSYTALVVATDTLRQMLNALKNIPQLLFNAFVRAKIIAALEQTGFKLPVCVPAKWVVDCAHIGQGLPVLKYLSRYLYRGVITGNNIVSDQNAQVTFRYTESKTGNTCYRTLKGEDFSWLIDTAMAKVDDSQPPAIDKHMLGGTAQGTVVNPRLVEIKPLPE